MASDIELFARLAADILKDNKANNTIPPEGLDAEKAGEKSEPETPETQETPPENKTEPPEAKTEPTGTTEPTTEPTTTTTTAKEN